MKKKSTASRRKKYNTSQIYYFVKALDLYEDYLMYLIIVSQGKDRLNVIKGTHTFIATGISWANSKGTSQDRLMDKLFIEMESAFIEIRSFINSIPKYPIAQNRFAFSGYEEFVAEARINLIPPSKEEVDGY